jgi:hypothetical protein
MSLFQTSRRSFLKAGGITLALPMLETFAEKSNASKPSKRMIFCGLGYGFNEQTFFPAENGPFKKMTQGMKGLERHKKDITIFKNLTNIGSTDPHAGSTSFLTGANVSGTAGKRFHNSVSCDVLAGQHLGKDMRYSMLPLISHNPDKGGHGPGLSMSWNQAGKPVSGIPGPAELYSILFGQIKETAEQRQNRLNNKRSILDVVLKDAKGLNHKISKTDKDKLEEFYQSIREIEGGLQKEELWANRAKPQIKMKAPKKSVSGADEIKLTYQLMALALQTNQTPVISYRHPMTKVLTGFGLNFTPHALSHYAGSKPRTEALSVRDQKMGELLAYFIDILKRTKDVDGSSLYDHTILSWGTNLRTSHMLKDVPVIVTGGGAPKIKHGRHLVLPKEDTPLCNLWLTLLQQAGVKATSFGSSNGILPELLA